VKNPLIPNLVNFERKKGQI